MNINGKIAKESAISFSGMGLGQFFRYLFTTLLARWVGVELLGIYSIANAVTRIFEVIAKMGLDQGTLRQVSRENKLENKQRVITSALKMGLISSLLFMTLQILIAGYLSENIFNQSSILTKVIIIHAISLPFYIIIHISASSTQAFKLLKYKIAVTEIQNPLVLLITMIFCYYFYTTESVIVIPVLISAFLGLLTMAIFLKKITLINIFSIRQGYFDRDLLNYSLPIMFMAILGTVLHWTDIFMIGYFADTESVGLYHPAARTAGIVRIILLSFTGIYGPIMAEMYVKKQIQEMDYIYKLVTRWIITFASPLTILILLFSKKIMLIFGVEFLAGSTILIVLVIASFIQAVFGIGGTTLNMTGFPKINFYNTFMACGLNIGLNCFLIPKYGSIGAAYSTLITLSCIGILRGLQNWKLLSLIPFSMKMLKPLCAAIFTVFVGLLVRDLIMPYHTIITLFCASVVIFSTFFAILYFLGIDKDDLNLLSAIKIMYFNLGNK